MIYYFCFDNSKPTGGNKIAYRHVELLNELGIEASIVHRNSGFYYSQFIHKPPSVGLAELRLRPSDLFVLPEDLGPALNTIAPGIKKVIFNQNAYNSFRGYNISEALFPPYLSPEYVATLVVSEDNQKYLEFAFPGLQCFRLHISFRQDLFCCTQLDRKQKQLCFMTRKNAGDVAQVIGQLRARNNLDQWRFVAIENASEDEVASIMADSALFLTFGHPEGISLSNMEAMSCGCLVIGYSGMGCREYFDAGYCREVPFGDITKFVKVVEEVASVFEEDRTSFDVAVGRSINYVRSTFSPTQERSDLLMAFQSILKD